MYIYEGAAGSPTSRLFRSDSVATGIPVFINLSNSASRWDGFGRTLVRARLVLQLRHTPRISGPSLCGGLLVRPSVLPAQESVVLSTDAASALRPLPGCDRFRCIQRLHPDTCPGHQSRIRIRSSGPRRWSDAIERLRRVPGGVMVAGHQRAQIARCSTCCHAFHESDHNHGMRTFISERSSVRSTPIWCRLNADTARCRPLEPGKWENTMIGAGGQSGFDAGGAGGPLHTLFKQRRVNFRNATLRTELDRRSAGVEPQRSTSPSSPGP